MIGVGVMVGGLVAGGVLDGVRVMVGDNVFVGKPRVGVLPDGGKSVGVKVNGMSVGRFVAVRMVGVMDGVLVSAEKPVGMAEPTMGTETRNECALADTIFKGLMGMMEMIGS